MLLLPKRLDTADVVVVTAHLQADARNVIIGLVTGNNEPDHQNVACQLEVNFPSNGADRITIKVIQDGNHVIINDSNAATDFFIEGEEFTVKFRVRDQNYLNVYVGPAFLDQVQLKHYVNDIRFVFVNGDVKIKKFEYEFS